MLMQYKTTILKYPILWFVIFPLIFVCACSLIFDLRPTAFYETLSQHFALKNSIEALTKKIHEVQSDGYSAQVQNQVDDLIQQREALRQQLGHFEPARRSDAYIPFSLLYGLALFLLMLAAKRNNPIPFPVRAFGISAGCLLAMLMITQWIVTVVHVSVWHSRLAGLIMILGLSVGMLVCCVKFIKHFYIPWARN